MSYPMQPIRSQPNRSLSDLDAAHRMLQLLTKGGDVRREKIRAARRWIRQANAEEHSTRLDRALDRMIDHVLEEQAA